LKLCQISQAWSNYLRDRVVETFHNLTQSNKQFRLDQAKVFFDHNPEIRTRRIGENLYYTTHREDEVLNASLAVTEWYNEIKDYDFATGDVKKTSDPRCQIGKLH
jgi:hypothetical protein